MHRKFVNILALLATISLAISPANAGYDEIYDAIEKFSERLKALEVLQVKDTSFVSKQRWAHDYYRILRSELSEAEKLQCDTIKDKDKVDEVHPEDIAWIVCEIGLYVEQYELHRIPLKQLISRTESLVVIHLSQVFPRGLISASFLDILKKDHKGLVAGGNERGKD